MYDLIKHKDLDVPCLYYAEEETYTTLREALDNLVLDEEFNSVDYKINYNKNFEEYILEYFIGWTDTHIVLSQFDLFGELVLIKIPRHPSN